MSLVQKTNPITPEMILLVRRDLSDKDVACGSCLNFELGNMQQVDKTVI